MLQFETRCTRMTNTYQNYGSHRTWNWLEDISAKGKYTWATTRTDPNSTSNNLDCIVVSSNAARDLKTKVTLIKTDTMYRKYLDADCSKGDEPPSWELSVHKVITK